MIMSSRPNSVFRSHRSINSVKVSNIAARVSKQEIITLFNTLIGEVCSSKEVKDCGNGALEISFYNYDTAMKALSMTGYTVSGTPLNVTPVFPNGEDLNAKQQDNRRNLYVLGLPFSLTKAELSNIFACYGTVTHCVILATLDNSSRRRGFVVMSTHGEAKQAMAALSCTQLSGHTLDISWAVVQRSQGFLDGGDRLMALDPRPSSRVNFRRNHHVYPSSANSSESSIDDNEPDYSSLVPSPAPTPTLLVSNLPTLLFNQLHDLHPLLVPFGPIKDIRMVEKSPIGSTTVIVDYATASAARDAKESLTGQRYANFQVETCYVRSNPLITRPLQGIKNSAFAFSDGPIERSLPPGLIGPYYSEKAWRYLNDLKPPLPKLRASHHTQQHTQVRLGPSKSRKVECFSS